MKIRNARNTWAYYSQTLSELVGEGKNLKSNLRNSYKKLKPFNQFLAWPSCPKRHIAFSSGYVPMPYLDLKSIKQFLKRHASLAHAEPLLRTSPLLSLEKEVWHGAALEKAVAIKRMAALMHEVISATKSISHIQATTYRG